MYLIPLATLNLQAGVGGFPDIRRLQELSKLLLEDLERTERDIAEHRLNAVTLMQRKISAASTLSTISSMTGAYTQDLQELLDRVAIEAEAATARVYKLLDLDIPKP